MKKLKAEYKKEFIEMAKDVLKQGNCYVHDYDAYCQTCLLGKNNNGYFENCVAIWGRFDESKEKLVRKFHTN